VKFLCLGCDEVMAFSERQLPGDGTLAAVFTCPGCGREMAMLTNPMETQLVSSLGVEIGGRTVPRQPMEHTRTRLEGGRVDAFVDESPPPPADTEPPVPREGARKEPAPEEASSPSRVEWSAEAQQRLQRVPSFVRGMVKRIYADYAGERAIRIITPDVMDQARTDLGLEGM
jgi:hypothetical protein